MLGAGCRVLGVGCRVPGAGCLVPGAGCWVLGAGCWVPGVGCWVLGAIRSVLYSSSISLVVLDFDDENDDIVLRSRTQTDR